MVIFLLPLGLSLACVLRYVFAGEKALMKLVGPAAVGASIVLQFVPKFGVHFLVPLFMQIGVIIVFGALWQLEE